MKNRMPRTRFAIAAAFTLLATATHAEVPLDGWLVAEKSCPALQSIKTLSNPGDIHVTPGRAYEITAGNTPDATHFFIRMPGVEPERRWVAVGCGIRTVSPDAPVSDRPEQQQPKEKKAKTSETPKRPATLRTDYVLAISWQPAFCESFEAKAECKSQTADRFDASNFALHGLWPQPRSNEYCDVSAADRANSEAGGRAWLDLPPLELSAELRAEIDKVMPGAQSALDRHEWTRHGSCYSDAPEAYFADSAALMRAINSSAVRDLFAENIGKRLTEQQVKEAFNTAFGPEAGQRVRISCDTDGNRELIAEITIGLGGALADHDLARAISWARATRSDCREGIVDAVGLQ